MSFSRDNYNYKSLPIHRSTAIGNSNVSSSSTTSTKSSQPVINTEEFAKLDALLQDLLAEVSEDQPILLNKESVTKKTIKIEEIEKSVDYLNGQKEILKNRKLNTNTLNPIQSNSKLGFSYTNNLNNNNINSTKSQTNLIFTNQTEPIKIEDNLQDNSIPIVNNKPPVSPGNRNLYSPTQQPLQSSTQQYQQQQQQQQQPQPTIQQANNTATFRSISTNAPNLKNITETDDELNLIDQEFDRYSQKSSRSTSTMQRSKYHVVSNDFTECTRPTAPTPVPTLNRSVYHNKRALSAPPTEMGKVVLQRMELKSPLTVRQGSAVPFEQPMIQQQQQQQQSVYPVANEQIIQQRVQTPVNYTIPIRAVNDPNRSMLRSNPNFNGQQIAYQQVPSRSVYLNRAYSETPRVAYTNGYETDSGLASNNGYVYRNNRYFNQTRPNVIDSDVEGYSTNGYRIGEAVNYRYGNTGVINNNNTYRTLGPSNRYQIVNNDIQTGYETDSGLVKLRQVLDNRRTTNTIPIQTNSGYFLNTPQQTNRCVTPSFNYHYNQLTPQQQQQTIRLNQYNNSQSNITQIPIIDNRYINQEDQFGMMGNAQFIPDNQQIGNIDFVDTNIESQNQDLNQNQSIIIQQQVAPSVSYQQNTNSQTMFQNSNDTSQQRKMSGVHQRMASSSSNLSTTMARQDSNIREESRRGSSNSLVQTDEVIRDHPKSIKATQSYWYKPKITRDEAISILKDKPPGTFLIRDSNNFPGAYGLALKVDKPPQNVQIKPGADPANELVRHFLIEPTTKGVRIKGCCNEPVFGSLAALVHQHSLQQLALPTKLILPTQDLTVKNNESKQNGKNNHASNIQDSRHLLEKGAACNVYFLNTVNVDNRNGFDAITYALNHTKAFTSKDSSQLLLIQFKVTSQGVTLTDINKKKFVRQHLATNTVVYCAVDEKLCWPNKLDKIAKPRIFGVVCKPKITSGNNECHLFVELDPEQPAIAIVDFINRYLIPSKTLK